MKDFKLKVILSILSALVFAFIFILLSFIIPITKKDTQIIDNSAGKLSKISNSLKK